MQVPGVYVCVGDKEISPFISRFEMDRSLGGDLDSMELVFTDRYDELAASMLKGDILQVSWGYNQSFELLFEGPVSSIEKSQGTVTLKALDNSIAFNGIIISKTFQDEPASEILKTILSPSGLALEIEDSDLSYSIFPVFNQSASSVLSKISEDASRHAGVDYYQQQKAKTFSWRALDTSKPAVMDFVSGGNIIEWKQGNQLTTLIVPVFCGDIVTVDGLRYLVYSVRYRWGKGGRTSLKVKAV